ncbi:hypothetical protein E0765_04325 [Sulfuricurvum sp. IAE1]|jgi:hypothetical protein|uniref:hypothetical protein n=1 Tax=Sulfuricurvum sp. IAE1 TaxID=2546102 RepID=UPI00104B8BB1|nr:hypothetical protein [Sulfuricurvum sp. IAE1]MDX9967150.1 hypothetical protein [Sulfuricurvum sp.]TDA67138.1 hypothetical protein E0765_04325 [Sulfuricurvum sp. IAE1]
MVLFGHPHVPSERFYHIESIEAVRHTPANSVVALFFSPANLDIIRYLKDNGVRFALFVDNQGDAVIAENLRASYLIVNPKAGSAIQSVAEHYLFDAKVLGYIDDPQRLEELIDLRLDGAIFPEAIIKVTT